MLPVPRLLTWGSGAPRPPGCSPGALGPGDLEFSLGPIGTGPAPRLMDDIGCQVSAAGVLVSRAGTMWPLMARLTESLLAPWPLLETSLADIPEAGSRPIAWTLDLEPPPR